MLMLLRALLLILLIHTPNTQAAPYRFIAGSDLYTALSQDSMMLKGYFLGVIDVLKDVDHAQCFKVPLSADADQQMVRSFLHYWEQKSIPEDPVEAISEALSKAHPC